MSDGNPMKPELRITHPPEADPAMSGDKEWFEIETPSGNNRWVVNAAGAKEYQDSHYIVRALGYLAPSEPVLGCIVSLLHPDVVVHMSEEALRDEVAKAWEIAREELCRRSVT